MWFPFGQTWCVCMFSLFSSPLNCYVFKKNKKKLFYVKVTCHTKHKVHYWLFAFVFLSSGGSCAEAVQQGSGLLVHRSDRLHPVSTSPPHNVTPLLKTSQQPHTGSVDEPVWCEHIHWQKSLNIIQIGDYILSQEAVWASCFPTELNLIYGFKGSTNPLLSFPILISEV